MKVEITKQLVLDAIENEDIDLLNPGAWIGSNTLTPPENCSRCMVGCVLNKVVTEFRMIHRAAIEATKGGGRISPDTDEYAPYEYDEDNIRETALEALRDGYPMTALSYFFEGMCLVYATDEKEDIEALPRSMVDEIREITLRFVRGHFPETMIIDINGAVAIAGLPVVQETTST